MFVIHRRLTPQTKEKQMYLQGINPRANSLGSEAHYKSQRPSDVPFGHAREHAGTVFNPSPGIAHQLSSLQKGGVGGLSIGMQTGASLPVLGDACSRKIKACAHTLAHTRTHTHSLTDAHTHPPTHTHIHIHTQTHTHTLSITRSLTYMHTHVCTQTHTHLNTSHNTHKNTSHTFEHLTSTHTCAHTHIHTHLNTHTHTDTHTHTHIRTPHITGGLMKGFKKADISGLAAEFKRALPLLCSQTAFMEGLQTVEEEELIAALKGEFDDAGACCALAY